jgi:hypothetical protein
MSPDRFFAARSRARGDRWLAGALAAVGIFATGLVPGAALADEGGLGFWLSGIFGSLVAVPQQQPGWALATGYYHTAVSADGDVGLAREIQIGRVFANVSASLNGNLKSSADLGVVIPSYAFATPVLGGQASVSLMSIFGGVNTSVMGNLTGTLTIPGIGPVSFARTENISDSVTSVGDLYPQFSLRWNKGVDNFMTYITGDIPVGAYDSTRLSNLGLGHGAIDSGAGYTYFNPQTGHELSAVAGFTYNFVNTHTNYQNGVDFHLDWGASQFLTKQFQVGAVGYFYDQVSGDSGSGDGVGSFESRVIAVGPQIGYVFPIAGMQGYLNLKGYGEFDAKDRAHGYNVWLTFDISPAAPTPPTPKGPMYRK